MQPASESKPWLPSLEKYTQRPQTELWKRPALSPWDRSIVTIAALIARNQTVELPKYFSLALDNGIKPREIAEIITHLVLLRLGACRLG